jgi:general stress protein 26
MFGSLAPARFRPVSRRPFHGAIRLAIFWGSVITDEWERRREGEENLLPASRLFLSARGLREEVRLTAAAAVLVLAQSGWAQQGAGSEQRVLEAARETMRAAHYCFLVTLDSSGHPQARVMEPFEPEAGMVVWMGTSAKSRKVGQIRDDERATLAYYDAEGVGYVTLIGSVRLVEDLEQRRRRWKPEWEMFYSEGPESDDYVLLEFVPSRIEVMSFSLGVATDPSGFSPAILVRTDSGWVHRDGP